MSEIPTQPDDSMPQTISKGSEPTRWFAYIALAIPIVSGVGGLIYMGWVVYGWIQQLYAQ